MIENRNIIIYRKQKIKNRRRKPGNEGKEKDKGKNTLRNRNK